METTVKKEKKAEQKVIESLLLDLERTQAHEKTILQAIHSLQELCPHQEKEYVSNNPSGSVIYKCTCCKKSIYE